MKDGKYQPGPVIRKTIPFSSLLHADIYKAAKLDKRTFPAEVSALIEEALRARRERINHEAA